MSFPTNEATISRATRYPYPRPNKSFIFQNGQVLDLPVDFKIDDHLTPVLAIGSNMSPEQLRRKYNYPIKIPVLNVTVHNVDVVYGAVLAYYGSVGATIIASWGTRVELSVTFLDQEALKRMHKTESAYALCKLRQDLAPIKWHDNVTVKSDVFCYVSAKGPLLIGGAPVALSEIPAHRRRSRSLFQLDVQKALLEASDFEEESVDQFILNNVRDKERRKAVVNRMLRRAGYDDCFEVIAVLSGMTNETCPTQYITLSDETQVT